MLRASDIFVSLVSFILIIALVNFSLSPFSLLNFFGAIAGASTALVVLKGPKMLLSVLINLFCISLVSGFYFSIEFSAEFIAVALLAITLQSAWAAQLTAKEMKDNSWLTSREELSQFLLKIGPLSSLVSAISVIVLLLISSEYRDTGLLYTFVLNWSISQLVSVFLLPILLFGGDVKKISRNKRWQVILASLFAVIALSILFRVSQNDYQHKRIDDFSLAVNHISDEIDAEFRGVSQTVQALQAYFSASEFVNKQEFETFSRFIYQQDSSVIALAWVPAVQKEQKESFEGWARENNSESFRIRQLKEGPFSPGNITEAPFHGPIYFAYPISENKQAIGIDLVGDKARYQAMFKAAQLKETVSSQPITLIDQSASAPGMLIFTPIFNASSLNPFGGITFAESENLDGFIVAVVQMKGVIDRLVSDPIANAVTINVQDVTTPEPYFLYGVASPSGNYLKHVIERTEFNRFWRIEVSERVPWVAQPRNWLNWGVLIGCTLGGLLYQLLVLLMTAYSSELNQKVSDKTKELIIQKELSEKQNKAKSQFLINLSNELKTPIGALSGLLIQLNSNVKDEKHSELIEQINSVTGNLKQSVDTLADLSEIESGKLVFQSHGFDFHLFLQQLETMLNVSTDLLLVKVNFQFDEDVPHYVTGDRLRLQQLIVALVHNGALIFNHDHLSLSVKSHRHLRGTVTIFIVITPEKQKEGSTIPKAIAEQEFENLTTSMTMAKEICQRLEGAINLAPVAGTGDYMLSASFKLKLDESAQQVALPLDDSLVDLTEKQVVIISDDEEVNHAITRYLEKFGCGVSLYHHANERVIDEIVEHPCDVIFLLCHAPQESGAWLKDRIRHNQNLANTPVIGIAPEYISPEQLSMIKPGFDFYINKPIKPSSLTQVVNQFL